MEICGKDTYVKDVKIFLKLLKFIKIVTKGNRLLYDSTESKQQIYDFITFHFMKMHEKSEVRFLSDW